MELRLSFDTIPEAFDAHRPRYCRECFDEIIHTAQLSVNKDVLEIGPGTGQATGPFLETGCRYTGIELGKNLSAFMQNKYGSKPNFHILNADFQTYPFEAGTFDLIYSAATLQWIPEEIAFPRCFDLLRPGGFLAMFMTRSDEAPMNPALREAIGRTYEQHFHPQQHYSCKMDYHHAAQYGFVQHSYHEWYRQRTLNAEEYISYISTHCEHITLEEPHRSAFFDGIRQDFANHGSTITILDTIPLYLYRKPDNSQK